MNKIQKVYQSLTIEELKQCIEEIAEEKEVGFLRDGIIRNIQRQIKKILGIDYSTDSVEQLVMWEVCEKWYNKSYGNIEEFIKKYIIVNQKEEYFKGISRLNKAIFTKERTEAMEMSYEAVNDLIPLIKLYNGCIAMIKPAK